VLNLGAARGFGILRESKDPASASWPAASIATVGRGRIAATSFSFSRGYLDGRAEPARMFLAGLVREIFGKPMVTVSGSSKVDVSVNRLNGRLAINLVNTAGPHADTLDPIHDEIPSVGPLEVRVRAPKRPSRVTVEPGAVALAFDHQGDELRFTLPRFEIHQVVFVD
jgi:hypothetical protein